MPAESVLSSNGRLSAGLLRVSVAALVLAAAPLGAEAAGLSRKDIEAGVKKLRGQLADRKFAEAAEAAAALAAAAPNEARFLYLRAEALVALDKDDEARVLRERAVWLNPEAEAPHFTAGEMLMKMGRRTLAAHEWETILKIPPDNRIYDINAYMRLGVVYAGCGLHQRAADAYSKGLEVVSRALKADSGVGIIGGTEETIRKRIKALREKANASPAPDGAKVTDVFGDNAYRWNMGIVVKGGKVAELRQALAAAEAQFSMNVQPRGFRLFDKTPVTLKYDRQKKQVVALLNKAPCCKPIPFAAKGAKARIVINNLDCHYIFEIDATTGEAKRVARFEKDYVLKFTAGIKLAALREVTVTINGKKHEWGQLFKGVKFDYLPKVLDIVIEGGRPSGRRHRMPFNIRPEEPPIR